MSGFWHYSVLLVTPAYVIYFAYFCVFRFVAQALSRKTPIPSIHPSGSAHPSDSFGSSCSSSSIHPSGLLFVICHLTFVIWYFLFVICLFVICFIVVYCIAWYIFCYLMVLHGIALYIWFGILCNLFCMLLRFSLRRAGCVSQDAYSLNR